MTYGEALWKAAQLAMGGLVGITLSECIKEGLNVPILDLKDKNLAPDLILFRIEKRFIQYARMVDIGVMALGIVLAVPKRTRFFGLGIAGLAAGRLALQFESGELQSRGFRCPLTRLRRSAWSA